MFFLVSLMLSAQPAATGRSPNCRDCHISPKPQKGAAALKACPRNEIVAVPIATAPAIIILGKLEDLYVPVRFDHGKHQSMVGMGKGCKTCHHYDPKGPNVNKFLCSTCHPKTVKQDHLEQPGLTGAYHRQCLSCHMDWDKDTSCNICHEKKSGGRLHGTASTIATASHYHSIELKEVIPLKTNFGKDDNVNFTHKMHAEGYVDKCSVCHQKENCQDCHGKKNPEPFPDRNKVKLHDICDSCHKEAECTHCHKK